MSSTLTQIVMNTLIDVKIFALARFQALLLTLVGLLCGILYAFGGAIFDVVTTGALNTGSALAFLALIGMPIIFGLSGYMLGLIEGVLIRIFRRWLTKIETGL